MDEPVYLDKEQAARYVLLCPRQLDYLTSRNELAYYRVGRRKLFSKADLDTYMAACRQPARSEAQA